MAKKVVKKVSKKDDTVKKTKPKFSVRCKRFYKNNRIYCILMGISLVLILLIILTLLVHFIHQNTSNPYGHRLEDIKNYPVDDNINEAKTNISNNDLVEDISIEIKGRIIWFNIKCKEDSSLEDMQNIANDTLQYISPENLTYYDLHYLMMRDNHKAYFGDKSSASSTISWAKYNLDEDGSDEQEN